MQHSCNKYNFSIARLFHKLFWFEFDFKPKALWTAAELCKLFSTYVVVVVVVVIPWKEK